MPGIQPVYYGITASQEQRVFDEAADKEHKARVERLNTLWNYYSGDHRRPLKVRAGAIDDNVILNLCGQSINRMIAFWLPTLPAIELRGGVDRVPGADGTLQETRTDEQIAIDTFLEYNEFEELIADVLLSGFVTGHTFMRLLPPLRKGEPPRLRHLDARYVQVFWRQGDVRDRLFYRMAWEYADRKKRRQDIVPNWLLAGLTESPIEETFTVPTVAGEQSTYSNQWTILEYEYADGGWRETGRDAWAYSFPPIVDWKHTHAPHEFYGQTELVGTALNDAVNFLASNTARILRFHAHPRTIIKGADASGLKETAIDGAWELASKDADVYNLEMQSDLASSLTMLNDIRSAFFAQQRILDPAAIKDKVGGLTNFGVRMLFSDMLDNAKSKQSHYSNGLGEVCKRALAMANVQIDRAPSVQWGNPLPEDRGEVVKAIKEEMALGTLSKQTAAQDLGRDFDREQAQIAEEGTRAGEQLANTLVGLGNRGLFGG